MPCSETIVLIHQRFLKIKKNEPTIESYDIDSSTVCTLIEKKKSIILLRELL